MINEQIVLDTVKRMLDAGIEDSTIIATLKDIGLTEAEGNEAITKVKTPQSAPVSPPVQPSTSQYDSQQQDIETMRTHIEAQSDAAELKDTTTYNMLNMHEQKIDAVSSKVDEVKQAISNASSTQTDGATTMRLNEIIKRLDEIDAQVKSMNDLMKSVIDINRKILVDLEAKK